MVVAVAESDYRLFFFKKRTILPVNYELTGKVVRSLRIGAFILRVTEFRCDAAAGRVPRLAGSVDPAADVLTSLSRILMTLHTALQSDVTENKKIHKETQKF